MSSFASRLGFLCAIVFMLVAGCSSGTDSQTSGKMSGDSDERASDYAIELGMSRAEVLAVMDALKADDFSGGMQVRRFVDTPPVTQWMWYVASYEVNLEAIYEDDKLTTLNYWDATIPQDRYLALKEHASVNRIDFHGAGMTYDVEVIEIFNEGQ